jgi:hypothetical protein
LKERFEEWIGTELPVHAGTDLTAMMNGGDPRLIDLYCLTIINARDAARERNSQSPRISSLKAKKTTSDHQKEMSSQI